MVTVLSSRSDGRGDTERCTNGILTAVALADAVFLVVLTGKAELELVHDLACFFRQTVFFYQRQDGQLHRCEGRG